MICDLDLALSCLSYPGFEFKRCNTFGIQLAGQPVHVCFWALCLLSLSSLSLSSLSVFSLCLLSLSSLSVFSLARCQFGAVVDIPIASSSGLTREREKRE